MKDIRNCNVCEMKLIEEVLNVLNDKEILKELCVCSKVSSLGTDYCRIMTLSPNDLMDILGFL